MSEKQRLYTFFFQYKDLTHVYQFKASFILEALKSWSEKIQAARIDGADEYFGQTVAEEIEDRLLRQGLTKRDDLTNVWCCTFHFKDGVFGDLNITVTENHHLEEQNPL